MGAISQPSKGVGFGQTWQNLTASRAVNVTYYNTTDRPIVVLVRGHNSTASVEIAVNVGGAAVSTVGVCQLPSGTAVAAGSVIVPPNASYVVSGPTAGLGWYELRL